MKNRGLGRLLWSGEHWIAYLRERDGGGDGSVSGSLSLYHAHDSAAGEGTVAFVSTPALTATCTDNRALAEFVRDRLVVRDVSPFDPGAAIVAANIERTGDVRHTPGWRIESSGRVISVEWWDVGEPIVGPRTTSDSICFTILYFAAGGHISVDGQTLPGEPYPREAWTRTFGEPMSSFCFALSETMLGR